MHHCTVILSSLEPLTQQVLDQGHHFNRETWHALSNHKSITEQLGTNHGELGYSPNWFCYKMDLSLLFLHYLYAVEKRGAQVNVALK